MKSLLITVLAVLSALSAFAQLPDAPQPQPPITDYTIYNAPSTFKSHNKNKLLVFAAVEGFAIASDVYDVRASERAFARGYVEQNGWLVCSGPANMCRPSAGSLYARDLALELSIASVPSILGYVFHRPEWFYAGLAAPAAFGIRHIQGGYHGSHLK